MSQAVAQYLDPIPSRRVAGPSTAVAPETNARAVSDRRGGGGPRTETDRREGLA